MKIRYLFIIALSVLLFASNQMAQAQNATSDAKASGEASKPQDVGNKICPVLGEKIDEKTKATYEYKGKIYNFCCTMCIDEFKKEPQKYILKVEEELKSENQEKPAEKMDMNKKGDMPMDMHGGGHK